MDTEFIETLNTLDNARLAGAGAAVWLAGLVRGFAGFGAALIMAPVLSLIYGPVIAVPVMTVVEIPVLLQVVAIARRETDWRRTGPMAATAGIAIPIGTAVLATADPALLRSAMSVIVLSLVAVMASNRVPALRRRRTTDLGAAWLAGLMGGSTGIGGPPLILYFLSIKVSARQVRGDLFGYFLVTTLIGLLSFAAYGLITPRIVLTGLALGLPYMLGIWMGGLLFPLANEATFRRLALTLLALIGVATLLG